MTNTEIEVARNLQYGMRQVKPWRLDSELHLLGYRRMPDSRTPGVAKNMTTGNTYNNVNWSVQEIDTGMCAYHVDARRDEKFKAMQALRGEVFCVVRGAIWGI